ncbi:glycosyltransferase [Halomonas lysinitropha]|uniref:glycosyltransferase n=1 Tax=Halomonas lysinitropha TaxID=2607506 RepID=UPI001CEDBF0D|nr:glycosyltransferase [Halomonas lysinitropha]
MAPQLLARAFDLIHVHTPFVAHSAGIGLGERLGLPVVATYHTLFEEYLHHFVRWLPRRETLPRRGPSHAIRWHEDTQAARRPGW